MSKLENMKVMFDTLISTCKSEILIAEKMITKAKSNKDINKFLKEKIFWEGKLEVAEYVKLFTD